MCLSTTAASLGAWGAEEGPGQHRIDSLEEGIDEMVFRSSVKGEVRACPVCAPEALKRSLHLTS